MKKIHLLCNAHLDPVWQWEWEEGLAEALSTFRIAADFCEEFDGFIFNHNEAVLYQWVEEYEPELFRRIQKLVAEGKWHIMGGWYLQPDCNMPSGESIIRQIVTGRKYFQEKFGSVPTTAINFDSFGHSRGLVQILKKAGYDSYIIGRPAAGACDIPAADFTWVGYDGSEITTHLSDELYNSLLGKATEKIENYRIGHQGLQTMLVLWGIGNHGGGPSRIDLQQIAKLREKLKDEGFELVHSTPEAYFKEIDKKQLPRIDHDLNSIMIGCYTSQVRIKQKHRELENLLYAVEKMICAAEIQAGLKGQWDRMKEAEDILLFNEFHDILPGSTVQRAEEASLRSMDHAIDILSHERMRAFMSLASRQDKMAQGEIPVFVYNPHPYPIKQVVECEFQLQDQNRSGTYTDFDVYCGGVKIPAQLEKEDSSIPIDWRKRLVFETELAPFSVTPVCCRPRTLPQKPIPVRQTGRFIELNNERAQLVLDTESGWIHEYRVNGVAMLKENAGELLVIEDNEDPWGMRESGYRKVCGRFALANPETAGRIAGLNHPLPPMRIIEQGEVRTVVEAVYTYEQSAAVVKYSLGRHGEELGVHVRLLWMQPNRMVKLSLPSAFDEPVCLGQVMFGRETTKPDGRESVAQKWVALVDDRHALAVINTGVYAHDFCGGELRLSLLRSPAYCAHPIDDKQILPDDRYLPRIDIGERQFDFVIRAGEREALLMNIDREAQIENEKPFALSFFPSGKGGKKGSLMQIDNQTILLCALKEGEDGYVMRLFNPTDGVQAAKLSVEEYRINAELSFSPFEVKTLKIKEKTVKEISMDETVLENADRNS